MCIIVAAILSLTTHIYVMAWLQPYINAIVESGIKQGINFNPDPATYSWLVIGSSYGTAILMVGVYVFLYYHVQNFIPGKTKLAKVLIVIAVLLGIKGDLMRQPIMDFVVSSEAMNASMAFNLVVLNHLDKWLANILLTICLVYLCPKKSR